MNRKAAAEEWLNRQENEMLSPDILERPDTKWVFLRFFNVEIKVVLSTQPLLGTGALPDWLRNLPRGRASPMVALDTLYDNLCLWRCTAVYHGERPDRCTQAARELVKSFLNLHLMNWALLSCTTIRGNSCQIGLASGFMSRSERKTDKLYGISERILRTS